MPGVNHSLNHDDSPRTLGAARQGKLLMSRKRVNHTYHDFSRYLEEGGAITAHKKSEANFPAKLHQMLSEPQLSHIITWMPHGRAWKVLDKELLMNQAVPRYFTQSRFESFTRQSSGWGFKRLHQKGADFGCYYNEVFLRGMPKLTRLMRRHLNQGKPIPFAEGEPDFYMISRIRPLLSPQKTTLNGEDASISEARPVVTIAAKIPTSQSVTHTNNDWQKEQDAVTLANLAGSSTSFSESLAATPPPKGIGDRKYHETASCSKAHTDVVPSVRDLTTSSILDSMTSYTPPPLFRSHSNENTHYPAILPARKSLSNPPAIPIAALPRNWQEPSYQTENFTQTPIEPPTSTNHHRPSYQMKCYHHEPPTFLNHSNGPHQQPSYCENNFYHESQAFSNCNNAPPRPTGSHSLSNPKSKGIEFNCNQTQADYHANYDCQESTMSRTRHDERGYDIQEYHYHYGDASLKDDMASFLKEFYF